MNVAGLRLASRLDLAKVWPEFLVWLAVSVCTLGLGWLVVAGHFFRAVINSVELTDAKGTPVGRLEQKPSDMNQIGFPDAVEM